MVEEEKVDQVSIANGILNEKITKSSSETVCSRHNSDGRTLF